MNAIKFALTYVGLFVLFRLITMLIFNNGTETAKIIDCVMAMGWALYSNQRSQNEDL